MNNKDLFEIIPNAEGEWRLVHKSSHGEIWEKIDGSIVITGSRDGNGMKYEVHFKNPNINKLKEEIIYG